MIFSFLLLLLDPQPKPLVDPKVEVEFDKTVDFAQYKTFAWVQQPASNTANHIRITRAVERELLGKGLVKAEPGAPADLYVHHVGRTEKKIQTTSGPSESPWRTTPDQQWKVSFDLKRAEVGTLVLELWDGQKKDIVWRARGSEMLRRPDETEDQINDVVSRLIAVYPPKAQ